MKDIANVIGEISKVAVMINATQKADVFVDDSGHIKTLTIRVYLRGWSHSNDADLRVEIDYDLDDEWNDKKGIMKMLNKTLNSLRKIYKNGTLSYKNHDYEVEEVRHYKLY